MPRCPNCETMVGLENGEPEVKESNLEDGEVTAEVRLTRDCVDCGEEMKEAHFSLSADHSVELEAHVREHHPELVTPGEGDQGVPYKPEIVDIDAFDIEFDDPSVDESGGGRYQKNMISVTLSYHITCQTCKPVCKVCTGEEVGHDNTNHLFQPATLEPVVSGEFKDELQASGFDELV